MRHALDLARLQDTGLLTPAGVCDLGDPNRADRVRQRGSLCDQHIDLAQLGNDLFGCVSLRAHRDPPSACKPYFRADHFKGGGSIVVTRIDRLARSIADLASIVSTLESKGVALRATDQPIDTSTAV